MLVINMEGKSKYIKLTILVFIFALAMFVVQETPIGKEAGKFTSNLSGSFEGIFQTNFDIRENVRQRIQKQP